MGVLVHQQRETGEWSASLSPPGTEQLLAGDSIRDGREGRYQGIDPLADRLLLPDVDQVGSLFSGVYLADPIRQLD